MYEIVLKGDVDMQNPVSGQIMRLNLITSEIDAVYHEATRKMGISDSAMPIFFLYSHTFAITQILGQSGVRIKSWTN